jgi:hypothetical protein
MFLKTLALQVGVTQGEAGLRTRSLQRRSCEVRSVDKARSVSRVRLAVAWWWCGTGSEEDGFVSGSVQFARRRSDKGDKWISISF